MLSDWRLLDLAGMRPVGYTSGVFDFFHLGHDNYLSLCKSYCTTLVVAVDVDELVTANKGSGKPVDSFHVRVKSVCDHGAADFVMQMNRSNDEILQTLRPDFYFIPDNRSLDPARLDLLHQLSIELVVVPYTRGISSTQLTGVGLPS
ncbi:adenylyltransferase/cytidyltransferase family protein [Achromobacter insolitus]|uniref:adenylyltransferase/cytidyltransferase family protein n=1 Tax=Achromobacter insolitus TaxID=217204 RepID=UPI00398FCCB2